MSEEQASSTHAVVKDQRNANIWIGMRDGVTGKFEYFRRNEAKVSVFDSGFMLGDGIWEGIRSRNGVIQFAKDHIDRLFESAKAMYMDLRLTKPELLSLIHQTLDKNDMGSSPDVHIRLMVSRGMKETPHQNPRATLGAPLIVIIPEYKKVDPGPGERGLKLMTVHIRRGPSDVKDEMINHHSKYTDIQACIQANLMGADEALMLDQNGFVKTCNSTNFFIVRDGVVWAPTRKFQMQGITRKHTINVCKKAGIPVEECDFTLTETYGADEAFCTGTFPSQIPVINIDGRIIGEGKPGPVTARIQQLYKEFVDADVSRGREAVMKDVENAKVVKFTDMSQFFGFGAPGEGLAH
ncbi:D-aminoacid aminotransferase-like PLP-dependent enzyme [Pseudohyphozyma bogoriensis]|nr:D-aminoacid aminotransferase-like PLP-dependent enzyme [Pseudohyphozyma bogoriensis]